MLNLKLTVVFRKEVPRQALLSSENYTIVVHYIRLHIVQTT